MTPTESDSTNISSGNSPSSRKATVAIFVGAIFVGAIFVGAIALAAAIIAIARAFPEAKTPEPQKEERIESRFGGKENLEIIRGADRITACRLTGEQRDFRGRETTLDDYPTMSEEFEVPDDLAAKLTATILSPDSYHWGILPICLPVYGVRVTYFRGDDRMDVLLCFNCDQMLILQNKEMLLRPGTDPTGRAFFEYGHDALAKIVQDLFPNDPEIQRITMRCDERRKEDSKN